MNTALTHISVEIPTADMSLFEQMAQRMGWKVGITTHSKRSIDISLDEANRGETRSFNSVDDLMQDLMGNA
jgi:hypothetical protein